MDKSLTLVSIRDIRKYTNFLFKGVIIRFGTYRLLIGITIATQECRCVRHNKIVRTV